MAISAKPSHGQPWDAWAADIDAAARDLTVGGAQPIAVPDISDLRPTSVPTAALAIPTYDGSNVVVHPSVRYFPNGWNGHRYWMAMTPYPGTDSAFENPSIVVSDDGVTWAPPAGVTNPLVAKPAQANAYNSDPALAPGPDGRLYMLFRDSGLGTPAQDRLLIMSTTDGVNWTTPVVIVSTDITAMRLVSPALWWDAAAAQWVIVANDILPATAVMRRLTAPSITGPWSAPTTVTLTPALPGGRAVWHLDAQNVAGTIVAVLQDGSGSGGALYAAVSTDGGLTFTRGNNRLTPNVTYKSSFVPVLTPAGLALDVFVGTLSGVVRRAIVSARYPQDVLAAANRIGKYVAGDTYARPDSSTSLGTSSSGHAYTVQAGTAGLSGGAAYPAVAGNTKAVLDTGIADGVFTVDVAAFDTQAWLMFRVTDASNYWRFGCDGGPNIVLQKVVAGSASGVGLFLGGNNLSAGDRLIVQCSGSSIRASVGSRVIADVTDTFNQAGTLIGWQASTVAARFKNLTARTPT